MSERERERERGKGRGRGVGRKEKHSKRTSQIEVHSPRGALSSPLRPSQVASYVRCPGKGNGVDAVGATGTPCPPPADPPLLAHAVRHVERVGLAPKLEIGTINGRGMLLEALLPPPPPPPPPPSSLAV